MINYYLLIKPGIIFGNLLTLAAGFLLASKGQMNVWLFFQTLFGLALIIASGCIFNNYIDRFIDQKMERTKNRAFAKGMISVKKTLILAAFLAILGHAILLKFTHFLTVALACFGFLMYVIVYSFWKSQTVYATAIGSVAGAIPPLVGYLAVSRVLDSGALILFAMLILWQMPHFFSIAIFRLDDYQKANIPVLPVQKGLLKTKIHMVIYILAFIPTAGLLTFFGYTGYGYLLLTTLFSLLWLFLGFKGFYSVDHQLWGKQMLRMSLVVIFVTCLSISLG